MCMSVTVTYALLAGSRYINTIKHRQIRQIHQAESDAERGCWDSISGKSLEHLHTAPQVWACIKA